MTKRVVKSFVKGQDIEGNIRQRKPELFQKPNECMLCGNEADPQDIRKYGMCHECLGWEVNSGQLDS